MYLSANIPNSRVFVRKEFLYNHEKGFGELIEGEMFGIDSIIHRALGFHVLLYSGAIFWRLPLHALCWKEDAPKNILSDAQLFDNISYHITTIEFEFLKYRTGTVKLRSGEIHKFQYMFTIDYAQSPYSESPQDHKCSHILKLENGNFASMPNNRILWHDMDKVRDTKIDYLTNTLTYTAESGIIIKNGEKFFYNVSEEDK